MNHLLKIGDDTELVLLSKKGDTKAFEVLVNKYQKKVFNISYRMLGDYDEASEATQDIFLSAYKGIRKFKGKSSFSTWLFTIALNQSRNRIRQQKNRKQHEQFSIDEPVYTEEGQIKQDFASDNPSIIEMIETKDIQKRVQDCINLLDEEFREALVLRDIQGFSYDEISDMLKIPGGTVKSRLFRARENIKDCLKKVRGDL